MAIFLVGVVMLRTIGNEIRLTAGDSYNFVVDIQYFDGSQYMMRDGDELWFTMKQNVWDDEPVVQKMFCCNMVKLCPADTEDLAPTEYVYDVRLKSPSGFQLTVVPASTFIILPSITG